jgi:alginate O-acetyltransferase complex protein AlgI
MLGWVFAKNFDSPYISQSITEFWRRWHISLSTLLRDYLYFPLGGNRLGEMRTYINLAIVMLLGGLWHGASWNFVIWGGIHGVWLGLERIMGKQPFYAKMPHVFRVGLTFTIVLVSWVFFRAKDLPAAWNYLKSMFGCGMAQPGMDLVAGLVYQPYFLLTVVSAGVIVWTCPQTWDFTKRIGWVKAAYCLGIFVLSLAVMETQGFNPFIYFIF